MSYDPYHLLAPFTLTVGCAVLLTAAVLLIT
jgi:hypothetical protein